MITQMLALATVVSEVGGEVEVIAQEHAATITEVASTMPALAIAIPLAAALLIWLFGKHKYAREWLALAGAGGALAYAVQVFLAVGAGHILTWHLPAPLGTPLGFAFRVDGLGATFGLVIAFVWFAATIYAWTYMHHGEDQNRFYIFLSVVLTGMLGIAYAGTFLTLLPFFELMSLMAYVLVVHSQTRESMAAGNTYLYMSAFGGLALLAGIAALQHFAGTTAIGPLAEVLATVPPASRWVTIGLICTGFAVKAGAVPLHVWLPKAHPVAPSPASALLSGVMIKAGAYGILRAIVMVLSPHAPGQTETAWALARSAGTALVWIGVVTMLTGVGLALLQENAKRMLAYHSISQMGYILVGTGAAAYLGAEGAIGLSGATLHLVNHALFKACLFLAVGAVILKTDEANMYQLGGLWRYMPFTAAACLFAAAGIAGVPGLNGYVSKTLLHHAVTEAAHASHGAMIWAERLFVVTGIGTAASFVKLFSLIFLGRAPERFAHKVKEEWPLKVGMALLVAAIIGIGLAPNLAIERLLAPAALGFGYDVHTVEHIVDVNLFTGTDLLSLAMALTLGAALCFIGLRTGIFHLHGPRWMSFEYVTVTAATRVGRAWIWLVDRWSSAVDAVFGWLAGQIRRLIGKLPGVDYLPGPTDTSREFSLLNLDFNFYLVISVIAAALVLVAIWQRSPV
jgi:formate hydrogenlyase subunit 3/multisubunit Na+/H+ antiporter MnhD subunit